MAELKTQKITLGAKKNEQIGCAQDEKKLFRGGFFFVKKTQIRSNFDMAGRGSESTA